MAFFIFAKSGQRQGKAGFRIMLKYFKIKKGFLLLYKTNRFHAAVRLFSNRSQKTSKCGKNISDTLGYDSMPLICSYHIFDIIFDLLQNRNTEHGIYLLNTLALHCEEAPIDNSDKASVPGGGGNTRHIPGWRGAERPLIP